MTGKFYILDTRTLVGNCAMFWAKDKNGYTTELDNAGLYTEEETHGLRDTDVVIPEAMARAASVTHVRLERLQAALDEAGIRWRKRKR
jgi:hypothetical protein